MPRISERSVALHVAKMDSALLDAADRLFRERGIAAVTIAEVANEVGLARNSVYRYVPDKDALVLRWFHRELDPALERSSEILAGDGAPADRLREWIDAQLAFALDPTHGAAASLIHDPGHLRADTRQEIGRGHQRIYRHLTRTVAEILGPDRDDEVAVVVGLAGSIVEGGARQLLEGTDPALITEKVHGAIAALWT